MRRTEVRVRDLRVRRPDTHVRMYSITTSACACTLLLMVQRVDKEAWVARKILVRTTLLLESTRHPLCDGEPGFGGDSCTECGSHREWRLVRDVITVIITSKACGYGTDEIALRNWSSGVPVRALEVLQGLTKKELLWWYSVRHRSWANTGFWLNNWLGWGDLFYKFSAVLSRCSFQRGLVFPRHSLESFFFCCCCSGQFCDKQKVSFSFRQNMFSKAQAFGKWNFHFPNAWALENMFWQ